MHNTFCFKLRMLLWKDFVVISRHPGLLATMIVLPIVCISFFTVVRFVAESKDHSKPTSYPATDPSGPPKLPEAKLGHLVDWRAHGESSQKGPMVLAWSPKDSSSKKFTKQCRELMEMMKAGGFKLKEFSSAEKLEDYLRKARMRENSKGSKPITFAGVELQDASGSGGPRLCSSTLQISIRFPAETRLGGMWHTDKQYPEFPVPGPRGSKSVGPEPSYTLEGFAQLQSALSNGVAAQCLSKPANGQQRRAKRQAEDAQPQGASNVQIRRFSYPPYKEDKIFPILKNFFMFAIAVGFIGYCGSFVKIIAVEKELQIKESMKIMGMPSMAHWMGWFITGIVIMTPTLIIMVVLLKVSTPNGAVLNYCSATLLFALLILYVASVTTFCFIITVISKTAAAAAATATVVHFLLFAAFIISQHLTQTLPLVAQVFMCLAMDAALIFGVQVILEYESAGGQHWDNIDETAMPSANMVMICVLVMLIIDAVLYWIIAMYLEEILPGESIYPRKWYFCFQKSYWKEEKYEEEEKDIEIPDIPTNPENYEDEPPNMKAGIQIRNLRKVFGRKVAVHRLNLNMYEGQITVLLGHNGAGKSTTMAMLAGYLRPTSGQALLDGHDMASDPRNARQSLGFCPQHNVLFPELTVREHLYFFGKLKGLKGKELEDDIEEFLYLLELKDKENNKSNAISGGMQRKLAAGIALSGKTKVVMFDEPTSGMDPSSRRALWDLLREQKQGRTILLTTHFMFEADILGDRVAIMSAGRLECSGSPFFLKKRFGEGYRLVVVKGPGYRPDIVSVLLARHAKGLDPPEDAGGERIYHLKDVPSEKLVPMLRDLEKYRESLGVMSFGVSDTTMEEVFLKTGSYHPPSHTEARSSWWSAEMRKVPRTSVARLQRTSRLGSQWRAMWLKRSASLRRGLALYLVHVFLPPLLLVIGVLVTSVTLSTAPLVIELKSYKNSKILIITGPGAEDLAKNYRDIVREHSSPVTADGGSNAAKAFEDYLLKHYKNDLRSTRYNLLAGASIEGNQSVTVWYNDQPLHSVPLTLNLLHNARLKEAGVSLKIVNKPLPRNKKVKVDTGINEAYVLIIYVWAIVCPFFIIFPVNERSVKSKHLQFVSGVNFYVFWGVHFIFDFLCCLPTCVIILIIMVAAQEAGFETFTELCRVFALLICFIWGMLPIVYIATFCFVLAVYGYVFIMCFIVFTGFMLFMVVNSLILSDAEDAANNVHIFFLFFPPYCLLDGVYRLVEHSKMKSVCDDSREKCIKTTERLCCPGKCGPLGCATGDYFQWATPGIGKNIFFLLIMGLIFIITLLIIDSRICERLCGHACRSKRTKPNQVKEQEEEDSDVLAERKYIHTLSDDELAYNFSLGLRNVTKQYGSFLAVDSICVGVKSGEGFGLLGANGAGKTTLFQIMTGDIRMTDGEGFIEGFSINNEMKQAQQVIGYCPQFDALIEVMTGRETIKMYCLLRGFLDDEIPKVTILLAEELIFKEHLDKMIKQLSGGTKRKVSVAVALLSNPDIVFLDEPTTGMDSAAKRQVWEALIRVREQGSSILLTSHSMEECEALCTRLVIMVNGRFKCIGSVQYLKSKFAEGYTLIIKVKMDDDRPGTTNRRKSSVIRRTHPVRDFVSQQFPGAVLKDEYMGMLTYDIPSANLSWSKMFGAMEKSKDKLKIEDYSLGQTSLEQIFYTLTRTQKPEFKK